VHAAPATCITNARCPGRVHSAGNKGEKATAGIEPPTEIKCKGNSVPILKNKYYCLMKAGQGASARPGPKKSEP
jgi:hypothetical protein